MDQCDSNVCLLRETQAISRENYTLRHVINFQWLSMDFLLALCIDKQTIFSKTKSLLWWSEYVWIYTEIHIDIYIYLSFNR